MDGTGDLFADFVKALPDEFETEIVRYPTDVSLSYSDLMLHVNSATPAAEPFTLVAESFSTPLAIQLAAMNPPNLKGLVLCAGFATSPVRSWLRFLCSLLSPVLFRLPLPEFIGRRLLVGPTAPPTLLVAVLTAISSVQPKVLSARFRSVLACDARTELTQISVPILYIRAMQDCLIHPSCLEEIQQINPQTAVAVVDGPHLLFQREPTQTAAVVAGFVRQIL
jgi:pimeloyl-ACP methyl ester carboxylesterase